MSTSVLFIISKKPGNNLNTQIATDRRMHKIIYIYENSNTYTHNGTQCNTENE